MFHLNTLFDAEETQVAIPMDVAANMKPENIMMKEGDKSSVKPRIPPPSPMSKEDIQTYKEKFKEVKLVIKWTGKNGGGIAESQKKKWEETNEILEKSIYTSTFQGPFYDMLNSLVADLPKNCMIVFVFEGDNNDCNWTGSMLKAIQYLTESGYNVHVIAVKAMPSKLLINPAFFYDWRDEVIKMISKHSFETKWHFLIIGDDSDPQTKMLKEVCTTRVAHVIVNALSVLFHWNSAGDKFNAGARLLLEEIVKLEDSTTMEQFYAHWDVEKKDDLQEFICATADKEKIRVEQHLNNIFNVVHRNA